MKQICYPHSEEAETMVLGSILVNNSSIRNAIPVLKPEDFYFKEHSIIYLAMLDMYKNQVAIDLVTLRDQIKGNGITDAYLIELMDTTPTSVIIHYMEIVKRKSNLRKIYKKCQTSCTDIDGKNPKKLLEDFEDLIRSVRGDISGKEIFKAEDCVEDVLNIYHEGGLKRGITPGCWPNLCKIYSIEKGIFTIITGAPGSGKTNFMDCMAVDLADRLGWKIAIYSPEYHLFSYHVARLMENSSGFSMKERSQYRMTINVFNSALELINNQFFFIKPVKKPTVSHILSIASIIQEREGLDVLVIDPWNMLDHSRDRRIKDNEYYANTLSDIRDFSRKNKIASFLIAHPKKLEKKSDGNYAVARAYDICGSSEFNNNPDFVLSVWRNIINTNNPVEIYVHKARQNNLGQPGRAKIWFQTETSSYINYQEGMENG
jgi:replicative DNA helicase